MSQLSETVVTVQQSNIGITESATATVFVNLEGLEGYKVIIGSVEPRTPASTYLILDDETGDPVQLPPNTVLYKFFFYPTVPLVSASGSMGIGPLLFSDQAMTTFYDPFGWYCQLDQINPKGSSVTALVYAAQPPRAVLSDYVGYPYLGVKVYGGVDPITSGKVKVYLYYNTFE